MEATSGAEVCDQSTWEGRRKITMRVLANNKKEHLVEKVPIDVCRVWHPTPILMPGKSMDGGAW